MTISFDTSREEARIITQIAQRAVRLARQAGAKADVLTHSMDVTACHANGNPLRLSDLLAADDANFAHDVFGIYRHLDRKTGQLRDCFAPRYSDR